LIKMKRILPLIPLAVAGLAFFFSSCEKLDLKVAVPSCVEKKIRRIERGKVPDPPVEVWQWEVDGQTYFYFIANCCDQFNLLYDGQCNFVCAFDGGFSGVGDGNCPIFEGEIMRTLVWEDDGH